MAVSTLKYSPRLLRHERLKASLALETLRADSELRILNDELMRQEKSTDAIQVNALLHTRTRTHALTRSRAHALTRTRALPRRRRRAFSYCPALASPE